MLTVLRTSQKTEFVSMGMTEQLWRDVLAVCVGAVERFGANH